MARGTETKSIDGVDYQVMQLDPETAIDVLADLTKIVGPALAAFMEGGGKVKGLLDADLETVKAGALAGVARAIASNLDPVATKRLLKALAGKTLADGKQLALIYGPHFTGRLPALFQWAAFAVGVQFGDFLSAGAGLLAGAGAAGQAKASTSPST